MKDARIIGPSIKPGTLLANKYEVVEVLGSGTAGLVVSALDKELSNRSIALKILHHHLASEAKIVERFKREVLISRQLSHPRIVRVYDLVSSPPLYFLTMELVRGCNLRSLIDGSPGKVISHHEVCFILSQVLEGLMFAHQHKIVHRDLKPENVLIDSGASVRLSDFGVARSVESSLGLTTTGEFLGTPTYMAPEQFQAGEITPKCDLYSFGIMAYEMLGGSLPFSAVSVCELISQHNAQEIDFTPLERKSVPPWLIEIVKDCTKKRPDSRPASARSLLSRIQSHSSDSGVYNRGELIRTVVRQHKDPVPLLDRRTTKIVRSIWLSVILLIFSGILLDNHSRYRIGADLIILKNHYGFDLTKFFSLLEVGEFRSIGHGDFIETVKADHITKLEMFYDAKVDLDRPDENGDPPLKLALSHNRGMVINLLMRGANPNIRDRDGVTVLVHAVKRGKVNDVSYLLSMGADPVLPDANGAIPFLLAVGSGNKSMVHVFLYRDYVPDRHVATKEGHTAVHIAAANGDVRTTLKLLAAGFSPNMRNELNGETPLMLALRKPPTKENVYLVEILLRHGATLDARSDEGKTASDYIKKEYIEQWSRVLGV